MIIYENHLWFGDDYDGQYRVWYSEKDDEDYGICIVVFT